MACTRKRDTEGGYHLVCSPSTYVHTGLLCSPDGLVEGEGHAQEAAQDEAKDYLKADL